MPDATCQKMSRGLPNIQYFLTHLPQIYSALGRPSRAETSRIIYRNAREPFREYDFESKLVLKYVEKGESYIIKTRLTF
jgi:hypothetical protein